MGAPERKGSGPQGLPGGEGPGSFLSAWAHLWSRVTEPGDTSRVSSEPTCSLHTLLPLPKQADSALVA